MFKRLFLKAKASERAEIFSLVDFCLAGLGFLLELVALELLAFSFAGNLYFRVHFYDKLGPLGTFLALAPLCLSWGLMASISKVLRSQLRAGFGLDPRSAASRLWPLFKIGGLFFLYFWLTSWAVYEAKLSNKIWLFACVLFAVVWVYIFLVFALKKITLRQSLRDITSEEIPEGLDSFIAVWQKKRPGALRVSTLFKLGLVPPFSADRDIIVSEKSLAIFTPEALKSYLVMAMMGQLLKLDRNFLVMRLTTMTLSVPFALMLLTTLGYFLGYPQVISAACLVLVWAAVWLSWQCSQLTMKFFQRYIWHKLNSAAVALTENSTSLIVGIKTIAHYNLIAWHCPWWRSFVLDWPAPADQLKQLRQEADKKKAQENDQEKALEIEQEKDQEKKQEKESDLVKMSVSKGN
jgi:hypothetical protein